MDEFLRKKRKRKKNLEKMKEDTKMKRKKLTRKKLEKESKEREAKEKKKRILVGLHFYPFVFTRSKFSPLKVPSFFLPSTNFSPFILDLEMKYVKIKLIIFVCIFINH